MKDRRVDRGIWQTSTGYRVQLRIAGRLDSKRFPPTWTVDALRRWRDEHQRIYRRLRHTARGSFAADVPAYLHAVAAMPTFTDRRRDLEAWVPRFGDHPRWTITPEDIRTQLATWREALAPNTCNHRRTALSHLFTVLDGKGAPNPVREVPPFRLPPPPKRGLPLRTVLTVIRRIRGRQTRARLLVLLWTGMRPSELMRVQPSDVDLARRRCYVQTGKGGPAREIALNRSAVKAWRIFNRRDAWGRFSVQSIRKSLVRACRHLDLPAFRVYDLRHSFALALREAGADLSDIQAQLGHSDISLTRRYAPTVVAKLEQAAEQTRKLPAGVSTKTKVAGKS